MLRTEGRRRVLWAVVVLAFIGFSVFAYRQPVGSVIRPGAGEAPDSANWSYLFGLQRYDDRDYNTAVFHFRKAAQKGHTLAQRHLGTCLSQGIGAALNSVEGYKWLHISAALESDSAVRVSTEGARDDAARMMSAEDLAEGRRRASEWIAAYNARK